MDEKVIRKPLVRLTGLKQYFPLEKKGHFTKAVDGIDLTIYEGETFGLVGESGCGKSTMGKTLLQLQNQTEGTVHYYGRSLWYIAPSYVAKALKKDETFRKEEGLFGGWVTVKDVSRPRALYARIFQLSRLITQLGHEHLLLAVSKLEDLEYRKEQGIRASGIDRKIEACENKLKKRKGYLNLMKSQRKEIFAQLEKEKEAYLSSCSAEEKEAFEKAEAAKEEGIDLSRLTSSEMRKLRTDLQMIFQDPYSSLNPRMSVRSIIAEGMVTHKYLAPGSPRKQEKVRELMAKCGLNENVAERQISQFSGGQRQRIGIARALATEPKLIICDEAVSALDVSIQSQILNLLKDLKEENHLTYIFITHDLSVVKYISDRIGVMYLGNLVELSSSEELFAKPLHPYTKALLSAVPSVEGAAAETEVLEGDIPSPNDPPSGCKFHTRCPYATKECETTVPVWEEAEDGHFVACHHKLQ